MIMRIQRTAPETIGETEATRLGKRRQVLGTHKEVLPLMQGPFLSLYNKQDIASIQGAVPEGRATGSGGGGGEVALSPSQKAKDPETGLGRRCICANFLTHLFKK